MSGASGKKILEAVICCYEIIILLVLAARSGLTDPREVFEGVYGLYASHVI